MCLFKRQKTACLFSFIRICYNGKYKPKTKIGSKLYDIGTMRNLVYALYELCLIMDKPIILLCRCLYNTLLLMEHLMCNSLNNF